MFRWFFNFSNGAVKLPLVSLNLSFYKKNGNPCLGGAVWSLYTFKNRGFNFRTLLMLLILRLVSNTAYGQYKKVMKMFIDALTYHFKTGNDYIPLVEIIFSVVQPHSDLKRIAFSNLCKNVVHINCFKKLKCWMFCVLNFSLL